MRERDSQRQRVYNAEKAAGFYSTRQLVGERVIIARVLSVLNSQRVKDNFPSARDGGEFTISFRNRVWCRGGVDMLEFRACKSETEALVLHELAHLIHHRERKTPQARKGLKGYMQGHGWRWCQIYLKLVLWFMGREFHDALKRSFREHKVRYKTPRVLSPEQKLALANRLRRMRGEPIVLVAQAA